MVFEILEKGLRGFAIGSEMISIAKTNISLGKTVGDEFLKSGFVEVWLDREANKVGFKSTKNDVRGFKIQMKDNQSGTRITAKLVCQYLPTGVYDATKEDGMWVINVSEIARPKK